MGKQTDNLNALRERKALKERLYADTMGRFGGQMNDAWASQGRCTPFVQPATQKAGTALFQDSPRKPL